VTKELGPFLVGGDALLLARSECSSPGQERQVGLDGLLWIDGLVAEGDVDVLAAR
jgi:hypothetical protein